MRSQRSIDAIRQVERNKADNDRAFDAKSESLVNEHLEKSFSKTFRDGPGGLGARNRQFVPVGVGTFKPTGRAKTTYVMRNGELVPKE